MASNKINGKILLAFFIFFMVQISVAADITALRSWRAPDNTRLVLDLNGQVTYRVGADTTPARIVIEIDDSRTVENLVIPAVASPLKSLRLERQGKQQLLIIETTQELSSKLFQLPPNEKYGHRLVIDLFDKPMQVIGVGSKEGSNSTGTNTVAENGSALVNKNGVSVNASGKTLEKVLEKTAEPAPPSMASAEPALQQMEKSVEPAKVEKQKEGIDKEVAKNTSKNEAKTVATGAVTIIPEPEKYDAKKYRNIIVAIDAGHGGEDPGAVGLNGSHEKNVTLAIARELQRQMNQTSGLTAVLTRTGDYFIPLPERRRLARYQHKADIFVSIHADAAENRSAKGASVFALSLKGAGTATSRFAQMLAERENRSDLIGGVAVEKDNVLRNVLADMVVAGSLEHSLHMGRMILNGMGAIGSLHSKHVEQAGFAVLKEPGMVSLLVETGFISNPDEEKKLIDETYQQQIAKAVLDGIRQYAQKYPAPETYFAWKASQNRSDTGVQMTYADARRNEKPASVAVVVPVERKHRVRPGESLTRLAAQYQVTLDALRKANKLKNDNVRIGQILTIPEN